MPFAKLSQTDINDKVVLIRADMNVPLKDGIIRDDSRIRASLPTIKYCLEHARAVIVMTHLGRPTEGILNPEDRIDPIAARLGGLLNQPITIIEDFHQPPHFETGHLYLLQNVRVNPGEKSNSAELGAAYAALADVYVNDAFGTAHRKEASTFSVAQAAKVACAGLLLSHEIESLNHAFQNPERPLFAIVGGSKVSTKLKVLNALADQVDGLIVGGGIANTFLAAKGLPIGRSLVELDLIEDAKQIMQKLAAKGAILPLPQDVVVAKSLDDTAGATIKAIEDVADDEMILDIGSETAAEFSQLLMAAKTIIWNGPVGVFEIPAFAQGTRQLTQAIVESPAFSIAGGGDTLAAISAFAAKDGLNYISTGGGAFLEWLEQQGHLPVLDALVN